MKHLSKVKHKNHSQNKQSPMKCTPSRTLSRKHIYCTYPPYKLSNGDLLKSLTFTGSVHNPAKSTAERMLSHSVQVTAGKQRHKWHYNMRQLTRRSNKFYSVQSKKLITDLSGPWKSPVPVKTKALLWGKNSFEQSVK